MTVKWKLQIYKIYLQCPKLKINMVKVSNDVHTTAATSCDTVVYRKNSSLSSLEITEVTLKPSNFLLVNAKKLCDQPGAKSGNLSPS